MTSVLPHQGTAGGPWVRVTVLTPAGRADLALPADVPVAELVPMVRELLGRGARARPPQAWSFTGPVGGPLPPDATLDALAVRDGELLHLGPAGPAPGPPVLDDPADAVADAVRRAGDGAAPAPWAGPGAAVAAVTAACAVLGTVDGPLRWVAAGTATAGALAALLVAFRAGTERTGTGAALCAVPPAAAAGLLALPPPAGAGALLLAAAAAAVVAAAGQALRRTVSPVLLAVALVGTVTATAALARLLLDVPPAAVAAAVTAPALAAGPLLPRWAVRLAGVPAPAVPTDTGGLPGAERLPPAGTLEARARLARGLHAGASAGAALPAAGGAALAAAAGGGVAGAVLLAVTAAVLLLRARALVEPVPARVLTGSAVLAVCAAAVPAALAVGPAARIAGAAGLLLAAGLGAAAARLDPSPPARRALDVAELVLTALATPVALAAAGVFGLVGGW